jgi:uncharacterized membrane protein
MDLTMSILRLIHVFAAVIWVGLAFTMVLFIAPVVEEMGAAGREFAQRISSTRKFRKIVPSAAGLTVLSGLIIYYLLFGATPALNSGRVLSITIGALAGIAAMVDGIRMGRRQEAMQALVEQIGTGKPSAEQAAQLATLGEQSAKGAALSAILMVIALAGMTLAQTFTFTF